MRYVIFAIAAALISCADTGDKKSQEEQTPVEKADVDIGGAWTPVEDVSVPEPEDIPQAVEVVEVYPAGPYSLALFAVLPDMTFYNPWQDSWISLSDLYKDEKIKAFILVSSAGWCGPCLQEAGALISVYQEFHPDGLEIIYTLGNTNVPGDAPFDTSDNFEQDLMFMENWQLMTQDNANKPLNYQMYADPNREFIKYLPQHAWPLSMLVTTKDMGIRLIEEGYWSALMENKITLVLYNDVPSIPFE